MHRHGLCIVDRSSKGRRIHESGFNVFINHFYSSLYSVGLNPDVEFSRKSLRLADPLQDPLKRVREDAEREYLPKRVDISTEMEMVVSSLDFCSSETELLTAYELKLC